MLYIILILTGLIRVLDAQDWLPPSFVITPPEEMYAVDGKVLTLPCYALAKPQAKYKWIVNGKVVDWIKQGRPPKGSKPYPALNTTNETVIWHVDPKMKTGKDSNGTYTCAAYNQFGMALAQPTKVILAVPHKFKEQRKRPYKVQKLQWYRLSCAFSLGVPKGRPIWYTRKGKNVEPVKEDKENGIDHKGNLYLLNARRDNVNTIVVYFCKIKHPILEDVLDTGPEAKLIFLNTTSEPWLQGGYIVVHTSPGNQLVLVNQTVSLKCVVFGDPSPNIRWTRTPRIGLSSQPDKPVADDLPGVTVINDGTELLISPVSRKHQGKYRCNYGRSGGQVVKTDFIVRVKGAPSFMKRPDNIITNAGKNVTFQCSSNATVTKPDAVIVWTRNGQPITSDTFGSRMEMTDKQLRIHNVTTADISVFQCQLSNRFGSVRTNAYLLVPGTPPSLTKSFPNQTVSFENQSLVLPCRATGDPVPQIHWLSGGKPINIEKSERFNQTSEGDLVIRQARTTDTGIFECRATNLFGNRSRTGQVSVRQETLISSEPIIKVTLGNVSRSLPKNAYSANRTAYVPRNADMQLDCPVQADPREPKKPRLNWLINGVPVGRDRRNGVYVDNNTLHVNHTNVNHSGIYKCIVSTKVDNISKKQHIIITKVNHLINFTVDRAFQPGAYNVCLSAFGHSSVVNGGGTSNHSLDGLFYVQYRKKGENQWSEEAFAPNTSCHTVQQMEPGARYEVRTVWKTNRAEVATAKSQTIDMSEPYPLRSVSPEERQRLTILFGCMIALMIVVIPLSIAAIVMMCRNGAAQPRCCTRRRLH